MALLACLPAWAQVRSVKLQPPARDFGYLVGDILTTDAIIIAAPGTTLDRRSLPVPGPLNAAIELRGITATETSASGAAEIRLHAEYQNFLAPERVTETELPRYSVQLANAATHTTVQVPAWTFHVSPLRAAQQSATDLSDLRPAHPVATRSEAGLILQLSVSLLAACAAALAFAASRFWLPAWRRAKHPFAAAAARIRALGGAAENSAAAWQELHHAFDATAGQHIFAEDAAHFLQLHPRFAPARADIEKFFAASENRFFAPDHGTAGSPFDILALAKSLRRLERRR